MFDIYCASFEKCLLGTNALLNPLGNCEEMLSTYITAYNSAGQYTHVLEPQPCFAGYFTEQLIEDKLRKDLEGREQLKQLLCKFYDGYKHFDKVPMSLFSIEGTEYLAKTGIMADLPPQYALPFSVDERKMLFKQLRNDIANDTFFVRAINSAKFIISPIATVQLYGTNILILVTTNHDGIISSSMIQEKSICEAFYDFFENLPESNLLYNKEDTIKIIDGLLEFLNMGVENNDRL